MAEARRGLLARCARFVLWAIVIWVGLSAGLVLALRWLDPPTSAFMLRERATTELGATVDEVAEMEVALAHLHVPEMA